MASVMGGGGIIDWCCEQQVDKILDRLTYARKPESPPGRLVRVIKLFILRVRVVQRLVSPPSHHQDLEPIAIASVGIEVVGR